MARRGLRKTGSVTTVPIAAPPGPITLSPRLSEPDAARARNAFFEADHDLVGTIDAFQFKEMLSSIGRVDLLSERACQDAVVAIRTLQSQRKGKRIEETDRLQLRTVLRFLATNPMTTNESEEQECGRVLWALLGAKEDDKKIEATAVEKLLLDTVGLEVNLVETANNWTSDPTWRRNPVVSSASVLRHSLAAAFPLPYTAPLPHTPCLLTDA